MHLTNTEIALLGPAIGVIGGIVGAWVGGRLALNSARTTAQEQRRLEAERRQYERRGSLYQDMLVEARKVSRNLPTVIIEGTLPGEAEKDDWLARVGLFASPDVTELWETWSSVVNEVWLTVALKKPDRELHFEEYSERVDQALADLKQQMRVELGS